MLLDLFTANNLKRYTLIGLMISITLHIMLIPLAVQPPVQNFPEPMMVNIIIPENPLTALLQPEKQQIVSEPESPALTKENSQAKHLAQFDHTTPHEQIKRGDNPSAGQGTETQTAQNNTIKTTHSSEQKKTSPKQKTTIPKKNPEITKQPPLLLPSELTLNSQITAHKFGVVANKPLETNPLTSLDIVDLGSYQPFSRPTGSGAAFLGSRGHSDYLPHLADGDITLLNTKASKFAVFVRRVATQVFSELRASGWEYLGAGDIYSIRDFSRIRAIMDLEGKLIDIQLAGRSGSNRFDQTVLAAVKKGARDPRPPPEAAVDGKITFTFQAKSWVRQTTDPRSGFPSQARWLLLGTGLE